MELGDLLATLTRSNPNLLANDPDAMRDRLEAEVGRLSERARVIIAARFGLYDHRHRPLAEIAAALDLTRERVRLIERHALDTLSAGLSDA